MGELARAILAEGDRAAFQGLLIVAGRGPHQPPGVVVDHHGQVAVAPAVGELVDADATQPSRRSLSWLASWATRVTIRPTLRQANPSSSATATREAWTASHAAVSSNARVNQAPGRAHGTAATTTPWAGQRTRARRPPRTPAPRQGQATPAAPALALS